VDRIYRCTDCPSEACEHEAGARGPLPTRCPTHRRTRDLARDRNGKTRERSPRPSSALVKPDARNQRDPRRTPAGTVKMPCARCGKSMRSSLSEGSAVCRSCRNMKPAPYGQKVFPVTLSCAACGREFARPRYKVVEGKRAFCTRQCALSKTPTREATVNDPPGTRRAKDRLRCARRRARIALSIVDVVDPDVVYERDGWTCHVCHRKVDKRLSGQAKMGPTLDHLVPLAAGGEHSYANVALAHRSCNSKRWVTGPAQLALIG